MRTSLRLAQWSEPGGYRRKKKLGEEETLGGGGRGRKSRRGLRLAWGLERGGP